MKGKSLLISVSLMVSLAALATGAAISAQDKYTVKVPNGLGFSEFRGYEGWQTISISHNGPLLAVILGNPAMIDAFKAGIPLNGKPFPDGAKMAKIRKIATTFSRSIPRGSDLTPATTCDRGGVASPSRPGGPSIAFHSRRSVTTRTSR